MLAMAVYAKKKGDEDKVFAALAKEQEEELLWRDMENDLIQQLMRRLSSAKPASLAATE